MQLATVMRYDLVNKQMKIKAGIANGVANDFNNDQIKAELLKAQDTKGCTLQKKYAGQTS